MSASLSPFSKRSPGLTASAALLVALVAALWIWRTHGYDYAASIRTDDSALRVPANDAVFVGHDTHGSQQLRLRIEPTGIEWSVSVDQRSGNYLVHLPANLPPATYVLYADNWMKRTIILVEPKVSRSPGS